MSVGQKKLLINLPLTYTAVVNSKLPSARGRMKESLGIPVRPALVCWSKKY